MPKILLNGAKISYRLLGPKEKPGLVLIHGFPFNQNLWKPQLVPLTRYFRVLTYDLRGMGQSALGRAPQPLEAYVDDLLALMDQLGFMRAALCGLSMGGYIALKAAERFPRRFWALALCDTRADADSDEGKINRAVGIRSIRAHGAGAFAKGMLPKLLAPKTLARRPATVKFLSAMMRAQNADGMANALSAMAGRSDTHAGLKKFPAPLLALAGQFDALTPPAVARAMAAEARQGSFALIPAAGHVSNLENPSHFNRVLGAFLRRASLP